VADLDWVKNYFADVDTLDVDRFLSWLTDDIVVQWANADPYVGKEQVGGAIGGFYEFIDGMQHELLQVYRGLDGEAIAEANVFYTRKDGQRVRVRAMTALRQAGELISELRVYLDTAPVFEQ
jgi:ketosteroid isomerase-like protein